MIKKYPVAIIGAGFAAQELAETLLPTFKPILLVSAYNGGDTYLDQITELLSGQNSSLKESLGSLSELIHVTEGPCHFTGLTSFQINDELYEADQIVIATGAQPTIPSIQGAEEFQLPTPVEFFSGNPVKSVAIIGAGPVGVATAMLAHQKGMSVTLFTKGRRILTQEEPEISEVVQLFLEKQGINVQVRSHLIQIKKIQNKVYILWEKDAERHETYFEETVIATGMKPNTNSFQLEKCGIHIDLGGRIATDDRMRCSKKKIWAMGPSTGTFHSGLERHQAQMISHNLSAAFYDQQRIELEPYPTLFPFIPSFSRIGLREEEAKLKYKDLLTIKAPMKIKGDKTSGILKISARKRTAEIIGVHMFGEGADSLISFFDLVMRAQIPLTEINGAHHLPPFSPSESARKAIDLWLEESEK
ncbi:MAG: FAD-dependent oxidoreductase [Elusimicrobiota bacterium]